MTTTYDPFIPADGADQHRYDAPGRAESRADGPAWGGEQRWEPAPQWEPAPRRAEPDRGWQSDPRWQQEHQDQQRWEPEPARPPRWDGESAAAEPRWNAGLTNPFPVMPEPEPSRGAARGKAKPVLVGLVAVLVVVAGFQAYRIESMNTDNATMHTVLAAEKDRTDRLEQQLAGVFDPEAVSSKVLPSVFRVRAGDFTGTAFSVGQKADSGKSNLFTNYHVVAEVWTGGGKTVTLERGNTKINATIVKVNKAKDLALLRANQEIPPIGTAAGRSRSSAAKPRSRRRA